MSVRGGQEPWADAAADGPSASAFNDSMLELLRQVECRRADGSEEKEDIYRLRYRSYLREGAVAPRDDERLVDRFDDAPGTWSFGVYVAGDLASSIRLSVSSRLDQELPAMTVFPDIIGPMLAAGRTVVDPTRFVVDRDYAKQYPKLPYAAVRLAWLVQAFFAAEVLLATVRSEHQAFYKRLFGHRLLCPARPYPFLLKPISLMAMVADGDNRDRVNRRYPFLNSTETERWTLFGRGARPTRHPISSEGCIVSS